MNIFDYWHIFLRHRRLVIVSVVIAVVVATAAVFLMSPVYEAKCKIMIVNSGNAGKTDAALDLSDLMLGTLGKSDPITTQIEFIQTRPIFTEVIRRCNLRDKNNEPIRENNILAKTSVSGIKLSNILQLTYRDKDPALAVRVLNTIAQVAEEKNQELNRQEIRNMREFIEIQLNTQKAKLEQAEQATVNYKSKEKTVSIDLQTKSQIDAAANIKAEIVKLESQRQGVLAQKAQVESYLAAPGAQADPFYATRLNMLEQINSQMSNIEAQKQALYGHLSAANKNLSSLPQEEVDLFRYQRDEKITGQLYTDLLAKYNELEIKEAAKTASIKIIESAFATEEPVFPKKKKLLFMAILMGFAVGFCLAFLKEYFNEAPGSIEEIKQALPYSVLGTLPVIKLDDLLFIQTDPTSPAAESIRLMRANLAFNPLYNEKNFSFLITSALAGEGKSLISANLALMYSAMGKKTVLVNFDLRRPFKDRVFNFQGEKGIVDYLRAKASLQEVIHRNEKLNLNIIDVGVGFFNPSEVFVVSRMEELFAFLKTTYDISIINGPPTSFASEALDIARYVNGMVLVTDSSTTPVKALMNMQKIIEGKALPILGTMVNKIGAGKIINQNKLA